MADEKFRLVRGEAPAFLAGRTFYIQGVVALAGIDHLH
jgi:hypothetical protein